MISLSLPQQQSCFVASLKISSTDAIKKFKLLLEKGYVCDYTKLLTSLALENHFNAISSFRGAPIVFTFALEELGYPRACGSPSEEDRCAAAWILQTQETIETIATSSSANLLESLKFFRGHGFHLGPASFSSVAQKNSIPGLEMLESWGCSRDPGSATSAALKGGLGSSRDVTGLIKVLECA